MKPNRYFAPAPACRYGNEYSMRNLLTHLYVTLLARIDLTLVCVMQTLPTLNDEQVVGQPYTYRYEKILIPRWE